MKTLLISLFLVFLTQLGFAKVQMSLQVTQNSEVLVFEVQLQDTQGQPQKFVLNAKAQDLKVQNLILSQNSEAGPYELELIGNLKAQIQYKIPFDLSQHYFLSDSEVWHPISSRSPAEIHYEVSSHVVKGFHFIHSATGQPQTDISYVFGKFNQYNSKDKRMQIYLRQEDSALAQVLLENLNFYLKRFESNYGKYPYDSFSVIESPDEIGYAFPKMTWMGSKILRFPFILKTSLPHELLHSWWGNGVFVDYTQGNWCEGLTTFGADYGLLNQEEKKLYRIKALTSYLNYSQSGPELSLAQFISRGEDRSLQALGYDKALMVFVMLEQIMGEEVFNQGLRKFYLDYKYKTASWNDLFKTMAAVSGQDYKKFKSYWIDKPGVLSKNFLKFKKQGQSLFAETVKSEINKIPMVPILGQFNFKSRTEKFRLQVLPSGEDLINNEFSFNELPLSYVFDPDFYLFRNLEELERPLNFTEFFGAPEIHYQKGAIEWLTSLQQVFSQKKWTFVPQSLSFEKSQKVLLSLEEAFANSTIQKQFLKKQISLSGKTLKIAGQNFSVAESAVFLSLRVQNTSVFIVHLNQQQPLLRWLQRWSRYGGQSFVVLGPAAALLQGVWIEPFPIDVTGT